MSFEAASPASPPRRLLAPWAPTDERVGALPTRLDALHFTFTNRCNLRCVYCPQGSHPEDFHADVTPAFMTALLGYLRQFQVREASIGYYGEVLLVKGWEQHANAILDLGVRMSAVSNFSRVLTPSEVATFARFRQIMVSIDTHDPATLKAIRKAVDARTIVHNYHLLRAWCLRARRRAPELVWTGVLTDRVVAQLPDFVAYAASNGVRTLSFNVVAYFSGAPLGVRELIDLAGAELAAAAASVEEALALARRLRVAMTVQGLERLRARVAAAGADLSDTGVRVERTALQGTYTRADPGLPAGCTRLCNSPWAEAYLDPKGDVFSCCTRGIVMGRLQADTDLAAVLGNDAYRRLRQALYTGEGLDDDCRFCQIRPAVPVAMQQAQVTRRLLIAAGPGESGPLRYGLAVVVDRALALRGWIYDRSPESVRQAVRAVLRSLRGLARRRAEA